MHSKSCTRHGTYKCHMVFFAHIFSHLFKSSRWLAALGFTRARGLVERGYWKPPEPCRATQAGVHCTHSSWPACMISKGVVPEISLGSSHQPYMRITRVPRSIQVSDPTQHSKHPKQTHSGPPRGKHRSLIFAILLLKVCLAWQGISSLDSSMCQSDKLRVNCGRNRHFLSWSLEILKSKEKKRERETLINKSIH